MKTTPLTQIATTSTPYDRDAIRGLAELHHLSFATDSNGRMLWMSEALGRLFGGEHHYVGNDWTDMLATRADAVPPARVHRELLMRCGSAGMQLELEPTPGSRAVYQLSALEIESSDAASSLAVVLRPSACLGDVGHMASPQTGGLQQVLEVLPDAVLAVDATGHVFYCNDDAAKLLGRLPSELQSAALAQILPSDSPLAEVAQCLRLGEAAPACEISLPQSDGRSRRVKLQARPLALPGTPPCQVVTLSAAGGSQTEIAKLEHKVAELESYVQSVSHDLRSPLVSLLGFTRLLRQDYEGRLDETGRHFLNRIEQAGHTMDALIKDLLEISRIGGPGETRELVDPRSVLLQLVAELKPRLEEAGMRIEIPQTPPLVVCNRTRLYQVFSNLIGNALAHMGPCEGGLIRVTVEDGPHEHQITVADNGKGIAAEAHDRIFEMFQTLNGRGEDGSTGMGLAIVKKIAETYDGRVWVESEPGKGCRFHLTLAR